jgi:hypothetical protein
LLVKDGENCGGRVAVLELGGEWMGKKILLSALFVCFQGIVEDELEIGGQGSGCGNGVRVRHTVTVVGVKRFVRAQVERLGPGHRLVFRNRLVAIDKRSCLSFLPRPRASLILVQL